MKILKRNIANKNMVAPKIAYNCGCCVVFEAHKQFLITIEKRTSLLVNVVKNGCLNSNNSKTAL